MASDRWERMSVGGADLSEAESDTSSVMGDIIEGVPRPLVLTSREHMQKRIESLLQENRVLKVELDTYKLRVKTLQEENKTLRHASVLIQAKAEQEEEYISNTLQKKIHELKREKEALALNYEQEEECLTNDLSRKLSQLRDEKAQLASTLQQEQESLVNKLLRKIKKLENETTAKHQDLDQLKREKVELENTLEQEQESLVNKLWKRMEKLEAEKRCLQEKLDQPISAPSSPMDASSQESRDSKSLSLKIQFLRNEVAKLKQQLEKSAYETAERMQKLTREEQQIREENLRLQRKLQMEVERREQLCRNLSESESSLEMEDERQFNELSSSRVQMNIRNRTISSPVSGGAPGQNRPISPALGLNVSVAGMGMGAVGPLSLPGGTGAANTSAGVPVSMPTIGSGLLSYRCGTCGTALYAGHTGTLPPSGAVSGAAGQGLAHGLSGGGHGLQSVIVSTGLGCGTGEGGTGGQASGCRSVSGGPTLPVIGHGMGLSQSMSNPGISSSAGGIQRSPHSMIPSSAKAVVSGTTGIPTSVIGKLPPSSGGLGGRGDHPGGGVAGGGHTLHSQELKDGSSTSSGGFGGHGLSPRISPIASCGGSGPSASATSTVLSMNTGGNGGGTSLGGYCGPGSVGSVPMLPSPCGSDSNMSIGSGIPCGVGDYNEPRSSSSLMGGDESSMDMLTSFNDDDDRAGSYRSYDDSSNEGMTGTSGGGSGGRNTPAPLPAAPSPSLMGKDDKFVRPADPPAAAGAVSGSGTSSGGSGSQQSSEGTVNVINNNNSTLVGGGGDSEEAGPAGRIAGDSKGWPNMTGTVSGAGCKHKHSAPDGACSIAGGSSSSGDGSDTSSGFASLSSSGDRSITASAPSAALRGGSNVSGEKGAAAGAGADSGLEHGESAMKRCL